MQTWPVAQAGEAPHLQTPAVQESVLEGQSAAVQQLATGMHPAPQAFWPAGQTHAPLVQVLGAVQVPAEPQEQVPPRHVSPRGAQSVEEQHSEFSMQEPAQSF